MSDVLRITKLIPAHTKTIVAGWCKRDFTVMSPRYREIRARVGSPMDTCYLCGHKLEDGEAMALAALEIEGNKVLCQPCADELLASGQTKTEPPKNP